MTGALLLLVVGIALLAAAVIELPPGGRALGLARLRRWPRITAAAAGALCVSSATILLLSDDTSVPSGAATEVIVDELGPDQVREEVRIFIDGKDVGVLRIDEHSPKARLAVTVAHAGMKDYRTQLIKQLRGKQPIRRTYSSEVVIDGRGSLGVATAYDGAHLQPMP
jgi:hypothetical protein